jgi:polysaccharide biosynthesis transport protein
MDSRKTNHGRVRMLRVLERRAAWIVLCVVLATGVVYFISKQQQKKYTATASLVFIENQLGQQVAGLPAASSNQQAQRSTNVKLVQLGDMAAKTARRLDHGLTKEEVSAAVRVSAQGESNIVDVSATATSPVLAAGIANTYTTRFVTEQKETNHAYYASALRLVADEWAALSDKERTSSGGLALQGLAQSLGELADLRNGDVRVAQPATVPTSPSSPRVSRDTILAAVAGLLLGLAIAFLIERFDQRIREPEELGAIYRLPMLGVVPQSRALARVSQPGNRASREVLPPREAEAFQLIRAHLRYFNVERELRTLLVTSAESGDGKTTIARHLAVAAASMGSTVLLVEADLRHPSLAEQLDIAAGPGVADVVTGSLSLWRATQPVAIDQPAGVAARPLAFDVLVAGAWSRPNPTQLIESSGMAALLEQARETYDLVVLDTSPLSVVSDAFPLLRRVDGVVVVCRVGRNRRPAAERLRETLDSVGAPLLGVIANGVKARGREPYDAEADDGLASADGASTELAYERVPADTEEPPASTGDFAATDADGAQAAGSAHGATASVDPPPGTDS